MAKLVNGTRNTATDLSDLLGDVKSGKKTLPVPKVAAKKVVEKPISRGAVVKGKVVAKTPAPRTSSIQYTDGQKIEVIPGARSYRAGGNVEAAVNLMKKASNVGAYCQAMEKSENPLPAIGLLRYLEKKQAVRVK